MLFRRKITVPPPNRPQQSESAGQKENPAPRREAEPVAIGQHQSDERRRNDRADSRAAVDDAHRRRTVINRKPFRDRAGGRRKSAALAHTEQQPARRECNHATRQTVARARERPENHDAQKTAPRSQPVQEQATADIHQAVGDQKRRIQTRLDLVAERDVHLDRLNRPRQRLPVQIADGDRGADEKCN